MKHARIMHARTKRGICRSFNDDSLGRGRAISPSLKSNCVREHVYNKRKRAHNQKTPTLKSGLSRNPISSASKDAEHLDPDPKRIAFQVGSPIARNFDFSEQKNF
jgi:hypothetical protein